MKRDVGSALGDVPNSVGDDLVPNANAVLIQRNIIQQRLRHGCRKLSIYNAEVEAERERIGLAVVIDALALSSDKDIAGLQLNVQFSDQRVGQR